MLTLSGQPYQTSLIRTLLVQNSALRQSGMIPQGLLNQSGKQLELKLLTSGMPSAISIILAG